MARRLLSSNSLIILIVGIVCGVILTLLYQIIFLNLSYNGMMFTFTSKLIKMEFPAHSVKDGLMIKNNLDILYEKNAVAKKMSQDVTLLCWVLTQSSALYSKGNAIINTWGKRCNFLVFFSSKEDQGFPAIGLHVPEGRQNLWRKTRAAWLYVHKNYFNKANWFMKVDDDTFVIPENARYFLHQFNFRKYHYFGKHFVSHKGYNGGGSGYIFSKETLQAFAGIAKDHTQCSLEGDAEDAKVGECLRKVNIHPGETRDEFGEEVFHPYSPIHHLIPGLIKDSDWLHKYSKWVVKSGPNCCSKFSVSFHYIDYNDMVLLDFFIYKVGAFGLSTSLSMPKTIEHSK